MTDDQIRDFCTARNLNVVITIDPMHYNAFHCEFQRHGEVLAGGFGWTIDKASDEAAKGLRENYKP